MRSLFQALVLTCCVASVATAGPVTFGLHAGSSIPNLRDNGGNELSQGWSSRVAPYFGVCANFGVSPTFSVLAEVNYAAQGGKKNGMQPIITDTSQLPVPEGTTLYADFDNTAKLDYIEVPVLAKYHFGSARAMFVDLGPYVGFLISAKTVTSGTSSIYLDPQGTQVLTLPPGPPYYGAEVPPQSFDATTDGKADLNTFNWGFQVGAGASMPAGGGRASFEIRGGLGLANIQKDTATNGKNATGNLVLALGYAFGTGGD